MVVFQLNVAIAFYSNFQMSRTSPSPRTFFQQTYRKMIQTLKGLNNNLAVCTVYDCVPGYEGGPMTALAMFNEVILREAFSAKLPVIDLRLICSESSDYSEISPIEPSAAGGEKIVQAIVRLLTFHQFESKQSSIYA
jgi:hypothetical protein